LQQAGERAKGACAYVTLEPCSHYGRTPPCADALIAAGIASVVCAMQDPNPQVSGRGLDALRAAGIAVDLGLMAAQAQALNCGFVSRMQGQGPYVRLKMAQSLDGRNAMASGESQWITGAAARADVHRLRARSSAIITGIGSVLNDNPRMTARVPDGEVKQPLRVILDTQLRLAPDAKILDEAGTIVYCDAAAEMGALAGPLRQRGAEIRAIAVDDEGRPDLSTLLTDLANRDHCNEILVEAGATVAGAMLRRKLVHELWLYMAPSLMGSSARPAFQLALQFMHESSSGVIKTCVCSTKICVYASPH